MRFDDSLATVLSADVSTGFGAAATWRQLVDLMGRGRTAADASALARLRLLRQAVPADVRAASARALAHARPDLALVALFAEDELAIAAPVLRHAVLPAADWLQIMPRLTPPQRSVLRHRRDLHDEVTRALESFGSVDFVIEGASTARAADAGAGEAASFLAEPAETRPLETDRAAGVPSLDTPLSDTPFVALGTVTRGLPVVAEALRRSEQTSVPTKGEPSGYAISDLVARIEAFTRRRGEPAATTPPVSAPGPADRFVFQTDALGTIVDVDGAARAALVGLSFALGGVTGAAQVDGVVAGAFRRRSRFADARLVIEGHSDAAGHWRLSGTPWFDPDTGRFVGYRGTARRPRADEEAEPHAGAHRPGADSLRQLVHELRTPTNAIAGFAELIESELLGPVSPTYRERAGTIRAHAADLVAAIEDLDTAARIETEALELRPALVDPGALVARVLADLQPLARLRGAHTILAAEGATRAIAADDRATERLVGRLLAATISAAASGERVGVSIADSGDAIAIVVDRPRGLVADDGDERVLLALGDGAEEPAGAPLLGTAFALRLARNLAAELGGGLDVGAVRLTLRLPAVVDREVGRQKDL